MNSLNSWGDKYRTTTSQPIHKKEKVIRLANELVRIEWVLRDLFEIEIPEGVDAWRVHCPWGREHSDKGVAKTFRVYSETNTSMCFATHGQYSPVRLWANQNRMKQSDAAQEMMRSYGVGHVRESYRARMARLQTPTPQPPMDTNHVLHYLLPTHPGYLSHQHHPEVRKFVIEWSEVKFSRKDFEQRKEALWKLLDRLG